MNKSWAGPVITGSIVVGVIGILVFNSTSVPDRKRPASTNPEVVKKDEAPATATGAQEKPIGDPVVKNHIQVAAVYLAAVTMDGMDQGSSGGVELIHLEADIKATEDNPNGFGKDEFVPYLKVAYEIVPARGGPAIEKGELTPMVAWDGLHYGANLAMPGAGDYRLVYRIQPPSAGGLGRHSDKATGVAPWWEPFEAAFDWSVEPKAGSASLAGGR